MGVCQYCRTLRHRFTDGDVRANSSGLFDADNKICVGGVKYTFEYVFLSPIHGFYYFFSPSLLTFYYYKKNSDLVDICVKGQVRLEHVYNIYKDSAICDQ